LRRIAQYIYLFASEQILIRNGFGALNHRGEGDTPTLAATVPPLRSLERQVPSTARERSRTGLIAVSVLTILAVTIHGYHPYAEDGGLYLAGVKRVLHPELYPYWGGFTTAHLRFSLFAPMVALLVRVSHVNLMAIMLLLYVASIWTTLFAAWQIASRFYSRVEEHLGAVTLLALLLTVPVAGTSLMLVDPYVSARSISTPCGLFALVAANDIARRISRREPVSVATASLCFGALFLALLVHPLMGAYALGCVLVLAVTQQHDNRLRWCASVALCLVALAAAVLVLVFAHATPSGYMEVARTRSYWFLSQWHWYEVGGLVAPLLVLGAIRFRNRNASAETIGSFAQMGLVVGGLSILIASLFARVGMSSYAVARLQPLRAFQIVYFIVIIFVGALLGGSILKRSMSRWLSIVACVGALMVFVQLSVFSNSPHLEFPWIQSENGWEQAFTWIKTHTKTNAAFALDADYVNAPGEDSQNFRAIAERSVIPDYSKDGGIASIAPDLTSAWLDGESAQKNLDRASDADRLRALRSFPVQWIVLSGAAATAFPCEYVNHSAKVCRIPDPSDDSSIAISNRQIP